MPGPLRSLDWRKGKGPLGGHHQREQVANSTWLGGKLHCGVACEGGVGM